MGQTKNLFLLASRRTN